MYTRIEKPKEKKSRALANRISRKPKGRKPTFPFVDNRPKAIAQRNCLEFADKDSEQPRQSRPTKENKTGIPDNLKSGIENLSGYSMDDVKVHYNTDKPAQLQAHAYAQGTDIHIASGQETHLPHEAWHVVQQKQGRVRPTKNWMGKGNINDDESLEKEADVMGGKAITQGQQLTNEQPRQPNWFVGSGNTKLHSIQEVTITSSVYQMTWESDGSPSSGSGGVNLQLQVALAKLSSNDSTVPGWVDARARLAIDYVGQIAKWKSDYSAKMDTYLDGIPEAGQKAIVKKTLPADQQATFEADWANPAQKPAKIATWKGVSLANIEATKEYGKFIKGLDLSLAVEIADRTAEYKWGDVFNNDDGNLPGAAGAGGYKEYYAEPDPAHAPAGGFWGANRILVHSGDGRIFVTIDHYKKFTLII